ncbi:flagellar hook-length control protein FliK [Glycocaulis profundi]|nr:flagellar hook-length control protein FliK [Glycocaulis profundi]
MRADAEPMPVRVSETASDSLTETARIERAAAEPARNPASQLQGQPHWPRLVPGHAAAIAGLMARRFSDGARVFDIRLDPAELGRVDVRMTMGKDGKAQVLMTAERAEALAELQRTHRELARELEEAGVELAEDGLSFELASGDDGDRTGPDADAPGWIPLTVAGAATDEAGPASAPRLYGFALHARTGVDVRA